MSIETNQPSYTPFAPNEIELCKQTIENIKAASDASQRITAATETILKSHNNVEAVIKQATEKGTASYFSQNIQSAAWELTNLKPQLKKLEKQISPLASRLIATLSDLTKEGKSDFSPEKETATKISTTMLKDAIIYAEKLKLTQGTHQNQSLDGIRRQIQEALNLIDQKITPNTITTVIPVAELVKPTAPPLYGAADKK